MSKAGSTVPCMNKAASIWGVRHILDGNVSERWCVDIELSSPGLQDKTERNNPLHVVTTATSQPPPIGIELNDLVTGGLLAAPGLTTAVHQILNDQ